MTATTIRVQMAQRKDTAANWTSANPILLSGELGYETDTKKFKIGNGSTNWNSLTYLPIPDGSGNLTITGNLEIGTTGSLTFEGSTADGFETTLAVTNPTADRTITLPNQSGSVLVSGNASIVDADVSASAAIAGTKISPNFGSQTVQTTDIFSHALGSETAPTVTFTGDTNTGIYSPGADQLAISTAGSGRLFVDASGNVGVGVSPSAWGESWEAIEFLNGHSFGSAGTQAAVGQNLFNNGSNWIYKTSAPASFYQLNSGEHIWYSASSGTAGNSVSLLERLRITSTGTVNIVGAGTGGSTQAVSFNGSAPVNSLVLTSGGRVGIGASSPGVRLEVLDSIAGGSDNTIATLHNFSDTGGDTRYAGLNFRIGTDNGTSAIRAFRTNSANNYETNLSFWTNPSGATQTPVQRMTLDSSGRLLVGTSSAVGGYTLQIEADNASNPTGGAVLLRRGLSNVTISSSGFQLGTIAAGSQTNVGGFIRFESDGGWGSDDYPTRLVFSVTPDGGSSPTTSPSAMTINSGQEVLIGYSADNGAYKLQVNSQIFATSATIATSDGRYKENVATLDGCVDLVKALRPVSFDWKHQEPITRINEEGETVVVREAHNFPDGTQVGFIAQEVEEVLTDKPWLGSVIKQNVRPAVTDNDGNELAPEEEFLGIAEGNLVAVLTCALKDAIGRIESLEAEVAALKA